MITENFYVNIHFVMQPSVLNRLSKRLMPLPIRFFQSRAQLTSSTVAKPSNSSTESNSNSNSILSKSNVPNSSSDSSPTSNQLNPDNNTDTVFPASTELGTLNFEQKDWSNSFYGISVKPFPSEVANVLMEPVNPEDVEIKPDGLLYLPEIKYRRILNRAFGPGGWGLVPRGDHSVTPKNISREYALLCHGRFVSIARGEQDYFEPSGLPTAAEGCKSNALMRCCKDLGIASELWDPSFIRKFKKEQCVEVWAEHVTTKKRKKLWRRKDCTLEYPYKEIN
ncbi:uncharacterized protein VTP21DRAFT_1287 [Calcarisporiella thermophila]|uniref:uncharacterized protein n=1 Tax=Calcarisporiella thermophila TaxID=911321 RepID=UPI0037446FB3